MVLLRQGFVGGTDHLRRRISRYLEVVVVRVDVAQPAFLDAMCLWSMLVWSIQRLWKLQRIKQSQLKMVIGTSDNFFLPKTPHCSVPRKVLHA